MSERTDAVVVGAGIYGCVLACHLRDRGLEVVLLEAEDEIMTRASSINQGRVHRGYHYPRNVLTGLRSRVNYPRFVRDYADCVAQGGTSVYAVARAFSNVTARQFVTFCERIGAPLTPAPPEVAGLFDDLLIEAVFVADEQVFDASALAERLRRDLEGSGVQLRLGARVQGIRRGDRGLEVLYTAASGEDLLAAPRVLNCTYSGINRLLVASGQQPLPVKHELTEMVIVDAPPPLDGMGITVMCGPFFSLLPWPGEGSHVLSHVRYTPRASWFEGPGLPPRDPDAMMRRLPEASAFPYMVQDARRYAPSIGGCRFRSSLREVKSVLTASEGDDGRPILIQGTEALPGLVNVLGSKIDNVYDAMDSV